MMASMEIGFSSRAITGCGAGNPRSALNQHRPSFSLQFHVRSSVANITGSCVCEKGIGVEFTRNSQKLETRVTFLGRTGPRRSLSKIDSRLTVKCHFAAER